MPTQREDVTKAGLLCLPYGSLTLGSMPPLAFGSPSVGHLSGLRTASSSTASQCADRHPVKVLPLSLQPLLGSDPLHKQDQVSNKRSHFPGVCGRELENLANSHL